MVFVEVLVNTGCSRIAGTLDYLVYSRRQSRVFKLSATLEADTDSGEPNQRRMNPASTTPTPAVAIGIPSRQQRQDNGTVEMER